MTEPAPASIPRSLFAFAIFYGGMVTLGGVLGTKQVALGPLAVEAGIFPFLTLVSLSSAISELHGKVTADKLVRFGFVPLVVAILLTLFVLQLPTDPGMYEPAKAAFPIVLGQGWRMMAAGIVAYGVSVTLNIWLFERLRSSVGRLAALRGFIAAALSQIVDTLIFITISFWGERPIASLMAGQMLAKVVLSAVLVPAVIVGWCAWVAGLTAADTKSCPTQQSCGKDRGDEDGDGLTRMLRVSEQTRQRLNILNIRPREASNRGCAQ